MTPLVLVLTALQAPLDEGTLVVRQDSVEVAREAFRLVRAQSWTLAATIRYDRTRPVIGLSPILEVRPDTLPAALQYDVADPRGPVRILGQLGRGRFTVRLLARATERAREFSANGRTVVLDDSVFSLVLFAAWRARAAPDSLTAIYPRGMRRETLTLEDRGVETTTLNRDAAALRHVTLTGGANRVIHVWLSADGRLMKVEIPSRRLVAERVPGG